MHHVSLSVAEIIVAATPPPPPAQSTTLHGVMCKSVAVYVAIAYYLCISADIILKYPLDITTFV
jgi:hypothetical protein